MVKLVFPTETLNKDNMFFPNTKNIKDVAIVKIEENIKYFFLSILVCSKANEGKYKIKENINKSHIQEVFADTPNTHNV